MQKKGICTIYYTIIWNDSISENKEKRHNIWMYQNNQLKYEHNVLRFETVFGF